MGRGAAHGVYAKPSLAGLAVGGRLLHARPECRQTEEAWAFRSVTEARLGQSLAFRNLRTLYTSSRTLWSLAGHLLVVFCFFFIFLSKEQEASLPFSPGGWGGGRNNDGRTFTWRTHGFH